MEINRRIVLQAMETALAERPSNSLTQKEKGGVGFKKIKPRISRDFKDKDKKKFDDVMNDLWRNQFIVCTTHSLTDKINPGGRYELTQLALDALETGDFDSIITQPNNYSPLVQTHKICAPQLEFVNSLMPSTTLLKLNTVTTHEKIVVFLPPVDGFSGIYTNTAAHLSVAAYGCQYTADMPSGTVEAMGNFLAGEILKLQINGEVIICAQGFGAMVAHFVTLGLERAGIHVEMLMLDGRPEYPSWYPDIETSKDRLSLIQICNNFLIMFGDVGETIGDEAKDSEAVAGTVNIIARLSKLPESLIRVALEKYRQRVEAIFGFGVDRKVNCNIVLAKTSKKNVFAGNYMKKATIEQITSGIVSLEIADGDLVDLGNDDVVVQQLKKLTVVKPDTFANQHLYKKTQLVMQYVKALGIDDLVTITGENKGIQGSGSGSGSSYYDAILVALFAFCDDFDGILTRKISNANKLLEVQRVLREGIVYPLRKHQIVRSDMVIEFRMALTNAKIQYKGTDGNMWDWFTKFLTAMLPENHKVNLLELDVSSDEENLNIGQILKDDEDDFNEATHLILHLPRDASDEFKKVAPTPVLKSSGNKDFELFALVAFEDNHFVSFVKAGNSDWVKYDSMAEQQQHNNVAQYVPEVWPIQGIERLCTVEGMLSLKKKYKKEKFFPLQERTILCKSDLVLYRQRQP